MNEGCLPFVVAIDGPAASGKGTLSRRIANHYGFAHLDTGALYRATGRDVLTAGLDPSDAFAAAKMAALLDPTSFTDPRLRDEAVGHAASVVAAHSAVRAALLDFQRRFARQPPGGARGAVLDGRDIGTIVCPDAPVKLFVTASPQVRAHRRVLELRAKGECPDEASILNDLITRDHRDSTRADAPLVPAPDAVIIDTSEIDANAVFAAARLVVDRCWRSLDD